MIFALIGFVLLLFSGLSFLIAGAQWFSWLHLVASLGLLGYGVFSGAAELREAMGRGTRRGGHSLLQIGLLIVSLIFVAYLSTRERLELRWDWTEAGVHSLSRGSRDLLAQVPAEQPIDVLAFVTQGAEDPVRRVLEMYDYASDRFSYELFDPEQRPDLASRYEITQSGVLLVCGGPCAEATATVRVVEVSEQEITRAIRSVVSDQKKVYFVEGHGEGGLADAETGGLSVIKGVLDAENLVVESLILASREGGVPEDADAVVIAGPSHSVFDRELEALDRYLTGGGSVALLVDPIVVTNLEEQVESWGLRLGADIIVDQTVQLFSGPRIGVAPVVSDYDAEHPITKDMGQAATLFQLARSVQAADGAEITELARTGPSSWAETDLETFSSQGAVRLDPEEDMVGPVPIAAARTFETEGGEREGRLVVIGDADFVTNRHVAKGFNADFFLNTVNWLTGEEDFITIERKTPRASMAQMTWQQYATFMYLAIFVVPEVILLAGILNWWQRRRF